MLTSRSHTKMATLNGTDGDLSDSTTAFNGRVTARVITDLGSTEDPAVFFPSRYRDGREVTAYPSREPNRIQIPQDDILYDSPEEGGKIALGTFIRFGLKLTLPSQRPVDVSHPRCISVPSAPLTAARSLSYMTPFHNFPTISTTVASRARNMR
jgi:hypothetical protein